MTGLTYCLSAEFTYNNTDHSSTKYSPFYANTGYHPLHPSTIIDLTESQAPSVTERLERTSIASHSIEEQYARSTRAIHQILRCEAARLLKRFQSWRSSMAQSQEHRHYSSLAQARSQAIGPFRIKAKVNDLAFTLDLPPQWIVIQHSVSLYSRNTSQVIATNHRTRLLGSKSTLMVMNASFLNVFWMPSSTTMIISISSSGKGIRMNTTLGNPFV